MIWLSVNRDCFIARISLLWKFYFSSLRFYGGITQQTLILLKRDLPDHSVNKEAKETIRARPIRLVRASY
ncbi:hypothetical protein CR159_13180 [Pollutimonas subterranea]|uniref:Uncharacterized protein n=1 Tax=Pollutimonas subterranea TaxID=2045210 RepID=A0A2N4U3D8_9BURK|nr:hypothetical protein CR159_13180 [Pollutimonas subterranea]